MECTTFGSHIQDIMSRGFKSLLKNPAISAKIGQLPIC